MTEEQEYEDYLDALCCNGNCNQGRDCPESSTPSVQMLGFALFGVAGFAAGVGAAFAIWPAISGLFGGA
jgi:hypothetical protein